MGSPEESDTNEIDASEGGLVWVRRRNGSWWPGRIMGLHELSESCLVSPKSGTPVKLLGREDASVDWYNLERSKRVKAFRCEEYNECIEKVRASAASSSKKVVKYARREDAIIHALELETARLGKGPLSFCSGSDKFGGENGGSAGELPVMSHSGDVNEDATDGLSSSEDNSNSALELSQSDQSGSSKMQSVQRRRRRTPNDSEDDGTEGVKRMRGLEDFGVRVMSKRKVLGTPEILQQDSASHGNSNTGNCLANGTAVNGGKGHSSTLKQKRSQVANVQLLKKKNRRRQLTKVLESTTMVSVPVVCDQLPTSSKVTDKTSGLNSNGLKKNFPLKINNSDSTGAACENGTLVNIHDRCCDASGTSWLIGNDSSDKLFDVPFVKAIGNEKHAAGRSVVMVSCLSGKPKSGTLGSEALSLRNEGQNTSCTSSAADLNAVGHSTEKGSSKWQSKGKRNLRHKALRKYVDMDEESSAYLAGTEKYDRSSQGACQKVEGKCKPVAEGQLGGFRDFSKHIRGTTEAKPLPEASPVPRRSLPYRQSHFSVNSKNQMADFCGRNSCSDDASLFDVKLEVRPGYRPQHVPLVSLVSKLSGKAFIGHHLTVEVLDNGYCDTLLSDVRRDMEGGDDTYCASKPNMVTRQIPSKNRSRFSPSKPPKTKKAKKSSLLNKKIRRLSSLTRRSQSEDQRKSTSDMVKGPVVACISLEVVFSRINEAVSSRQALLTHHKLPASNR